MTKLDQLINELCPNGVEFVTLGEVVEILDSQRKPVTRKDRKVGIYPYYGANGIQDYVDDYIFDGTFLLMGEDGSVINKDNTPVLTWVTGKIWVNNHAHIMSEIPAIASLRFIYFYLSTIDVSSIVRGTPPKINQQQLRSIVIPLPPLAVQHEIVRILDNFTEVTAELTVELTAELTARKKQYEYYRDQLLTFGNDVPMGTLGEIAIKTYSGGTPLANHAEYYGGDIPWLRTQEVRFIDIYDTEMRITPEALRNSAAKWIPANCVIIAISGATAGRSAINKIPLTTNQHCCCLEISPKKAHYRYVFHWVSSQYEKLKSLGQGARSDLNSGIIKSYPIPLPSLEEQARIVAILDKFDALTTDIANGLPTEIEARRKQYKYYRDKLLTFKEVGA